MTRRSHLAVAIYANRIEYPTHCLIEILTRLGVCDSDSYILVRDFIDRQCKRHFEVGNG